MRIGTILKTGLREGKKILNDTVQLAKIRGIKKLAKVSTKVTYVLLVLLFILVSWTYLSIALVLFLGELFSSYALGFLIVGALPLISLLFIFIFSKKIKKYILHFFIRIMTKKNEGV